MPSAMETLISKLKRELSENCSNQTTPHGFAAYSDQWLGAARKQARKPEQHILVDELYDLLKRYDSQSAQERADQARYMLDRIVNKRPAPPAYAARLGSYAAPPPPAADQARATPQESSPDAKPARQKRKPATKPPQAQTTGEADAREAAAPRNQPAAKAPPQRREQREQPAPAALAPVPTADAAPGKKKRKRKKTPAGQAPIAVQERPAPFDHERGRDDYSRLDDIMIGDPLQGGQTMDIPAPVRLERPPRRPRTRIPTDQATDLLRGLSASVETIKGIGQKNAEPLHRMGIHTINDLLFYIPRRYDDYMTLHPIRTLEAGVEATIVGVVKSTLTPFNQAGRRDFAMTVDDGTGKLSVVCFGQSYLSRTLRVGQQVVLHGETRSYRGRIEMHNPDIQIVELADLQLLRLVPVYRLSEGMTNRKMRTLMESAVAYWSDRLPDYVPEGTLERAELADLGWALRNIHFPESADHLHHARRRLIFDELLLLQLTVLANRRAYDRMTARPLGSNDAQMLAFSDAVFSFPFTGAQQRCIDEIRADVARLQPMNRLLQGDVGSGKTAVAASALAIAFFNGTQSALMAPTSILAEQHYRGISAAFAKIPAALCPAGRAPVVALLTGALSAAERSAIHAGIADGSIDIVIGTHALIQPDVTFRDLTLAIIDEQHRFGVEQRQALRAKGDNPHLLVMTATPIPRTLALTIHADLDLSIIDEMPPGRKPVKTSVIEPHQRETIYEMIEAEVQAGHQAFIVYPLVEDSDTSDLGAAVSSYERLKQVFHRLRVGLLHGKMSADEKDAIMAAFRDHQFDVMVTTSVAEVGVDIPNATLILIEHATRFGLAQLHQFRGRVGRGGDTAYCILVCDSHVEAARDRLNVLKETYDGFKLAHIDWELRGAGDLIGTRQSGASVLLLQASIETPDLIEAASRESRTIYASDPYLDDPQHQLLRTRIEQLQNARADVS